MIALDIERLAKLIRAKRGRKGLRETSTEIGSLSPSTLSRVENRNVPDMETFIALCNWLKIHPGEMFIADSKQQQQVDTIEQIIDLSMCDKRLDSESAYILGRIIKAAYQDLARGI